LWEEQGLAMDLAINLPPVVLVEPGLIRWLSQGLLATGISASRLHLELLESEEHSDITRQIGRFSEIADLGIHLDLDDLGSGYSSLLRLRSFHFDAVKIDQGLVRGYAVDPSRLVALMGSLVKLVQGLGHSAIIEGLESPSLVEAARILGADGGQGFHFSPPLSSGQVPEWTRAFYLSPRPEPPVSGLGREARLWLDRQYGNRRMKTPDG
jgi:EAL domain-containing protein (putative c-di-GMP-specific phosphodiesterase class I)